ncbi:MAG TPA: S-methyl-5-thioribose-1-phosphate isomerase [Kofleriaceae bacterium]|nr:S-methyl-5-thioribose-1-phosphate isomerase [Kofleriaceae bacterium]
MSPEEILKPLRWHDGALHLLDQLQLPAVEVWLRCEDETDVAQAIRDMVVRGAPAIGCAAAYGVALAARRLAEASPAPGVAAFSAGLERAIDLLGQTRPTAVNLFWALAQMREAARAALAATADASDPDLAAVVSTLEARAIAIQADDIEMCRRIGRHGAALLPDDVAVLTHCNAGALATGGYGTALGVVRAAREAGKTVRVLADETRPFLQGARLTAWELVRDGFDVTLIPDGAAAFLMSRGEVGCVVVGADRIAANGDVANKIGTYALALAAARHAIPFYVAAPTSTLDLETASGDGIPIEERSGTELLSIGGTRIAAAGASARYPAFDITPADLITAIITDQGVATAPYLESLRRLSGR